LIRALGNLRLANDNPTALKTVNSSDTTPVICQISHLEAHAVNSQFFLPTAKIPSGQQILPSKMDKHKDKDKVTFHTSV